MLHERQAARETRALPGKRGCSTGAHRSARASGGEPSLAHQQQDAHHMIEPQVAALRFSPSQVHINILFKIYSCNLYYIL